MSIAPTTEGWYIVMTLTGEYWRRSCGYNGHHKQVLSLSLHNYEVLIICQGVWSEAHHVLTAHPRCNNATLTREFPCQKNKHISKPE